MSDSTEKELGECCPHNLVESQWSRSENMLLPPSASDNERIDGAKIQIQKLNKPSLQSLNGRLLRITSLEVTRQTNNNYIYCKIHVYIIYSRATATAFRYFPTPSEWNNQRLPRILLQNHSRSAGNLQFHVTA